jgi:PDZ domain/IrrE N-terminal-like domain
MLAASHCPAGAAQPDYPYLVRSWQGHDARLLTIGTRLARANAPQCTQVQSSIGLMLTDFGHFAKPSLARAVLGLSSEVAVEAVARGGPAEAAGLRAGDELLAIAGNAVMASAAKREQQLSQLNDRIDTVLQMRGSVIIRVARAGAAPRDVTVAGQPACRSRFMLQPGGKVAQADGLAVEISLPLFAEYPSDDEAAFMVAHELAHNILGHQQRSNAAGRNFKVIKDFERQADQLAPWLMANAGYDPAAASRFMAKWGARHDQGMTRAPTHDAWRDRLIMIDAELVRIAAAGSVRPLDWRAALR